MSFHFEVNFSRKLSPGGILYLAGATLISSGSENSISVFLWGTTPSPTLIHGVQGWAPDFIGELGQSAYSILLATAIVLRIPERPIRLLGFGWNCWERGSPLPLGLPVTKTKQTSSGCWPSLPLCTKSLLKGNPKQRKAELKDRSIDR